MTFSTNGALYWMKQLFIINTNSFKNGFSLPQGHFPIVPEIKMSFEHKSVPKNLFLSACFCWDSSLSLREMDQNSKFGRTIGFGNSYLEFFFRLFKVFRLHATLHDAAAAVRAHIGKGRGYCYMIRRGPNSYSLSPVTGLLFFAFT